MPRFFRTAIFIFFVIGGYAQASEQWQVMPQKSNIVFLVHSTLHEVNGQARELFGNFEQRQNLIKGFVDVGIFGLTTDNQARDKSMYRMFEASQFTQIHFAFNNTDISHVLERHEGHVLFLGDMRIHHISHPMAIFSRCRIIGKTLLCEGQMLISLKDYDLKPPSVLGIIQVKDEVLVQFKIVFSKKVDFQNGH